MAATAVRRRIIPARDNPAYQAYLAPGIDRLAPGSAASAMLAVGVITVTFALHGLLRSDQRSRQEFFALAGTAT